MYREYFDRILGDIMNNKIYLHYQNDYNNVVECKTGYIKELLYMGSIYAYKDKQYRLFYTILILKICIFILFIIFLPFLIALISFIVISFLINFLFSYNYSDIIIDYYIKKGYIPLTKESSDYLVNKGIYFKLC